MTTAVCFNCGEIKFGAFCPCDSCGRAPKSEDEHIISLAMTDHHFDQEGLEQISEATKKNGRPPDLAPENREQIRNLLRECAPMVSEMENLMTEEANQAAPKKPWWKFW